MKNIYNDYKKEFKEKIKEIAYKYTIDELVGIFKKYGYNVTRESVRSFLSYNNIKYKKINDYTEYSNEFKEKIKEIAYKYTIDELADIAKSYGYKATKRTFRSFLIYNNIKYKNKHRSKRIKNYNKYPNEFIKKIKKIAYKYTIDELVGIFKKYGYNVTYNKIVGVLRYYKIKYKKVKNCNKYPNEFIKMIKEIAYKYTMDELVNLFKYYGYNVTDSNVRHFLYYYKINYKKGKYSMIKKIA